MTSLLKFTTNLSLVLSIPTLCLAMNCNRTSGTNQFIHIANISDGSTITLIREPFTIVAQIELCGKKESCSDFDSIVASTDKSLHSRVYPGASTEDLPFAHRGAFALGNEFDPLVVLEAAPNVLEYDLTDPEIRSVELLEQTDTLLTVAWHISELYTKDPQADYPVEEWPYDAIYFVYFYRQAYMDMLEPRFELQSEEFKRFTVTFK